ncbi:hypothetical protein ACSBR1_043605 [Camellia fascicularis]
MGESRGRRRKPLLPNAAAPPPDAANSYWICVFVYVGDTYCVCKDGLSDSVYQKNIDYACGAGANCGAILQNGVCYNPNIVKDHCNYAVNS